MNAGHNTEAWSGILCFAINHPIRCWIVGKSSGEVLQQLDGGGKQQVQGNGYLATGTKVLEYVSNW